MLWLLKNQKERQRRELMMWGAVPLPFSQQGVSGSKNTAWICSHSSTAFPLCALYTDCLFSLDSWETSHCKVNVSVCIWPSSGWGMRVPQSCWLITCSETHSLNKWKKIRDFPFVSCKMKSFLKIIWDTAFWIRTMCILFSPLPHVWSSCDNTSCSAVLWYFKSIRSGFDIGGVWVYIVSIVSICCITLVSISDFYVYSPNLMLVRHMKFSFIFLYLYLRFSDWPEINIMLM